MHSTTCWLTDAIAPFALRLKEYSGSHLIVLQDTDLIMHMLTQYSKIKPLFFSSQISMISSSCHPNWSCWLLFDLASSTKQQMNW